MSNTQITSLPTPTSIGLSTSRIPVTPGSLLNSRYSSEAVISPDGKRVAFTLWSFIADEAKRQGRIWTVDTAQVNGHIAEPKPLTKGPKTSNSPRWSPDGKQIAYIAVVGEGEQAKAQLHMISAEGGEGRQVCTMPNGISAPSWSTDGTRIAFLSLEGEVPKTDPLVVVPARHQRLWTVHVESDTPYPVTPDGLTVWEYAWSRDSQQAARSYSIKPDENGWYAGQIGLVNAGGGAVRQMTQLKVPASSLAWSPDGTQLAYISGDWSDRGQGGFLRAPNGLPRREVRRGGSPRDREVPCLGGDRPEAVEV